MPVFSPFPGLVVQADEATANGRDKDLSFVLPGVIAVVAVLLAALLA